MSDTSKKEARLARKAEHAKLRAVQAEIDAAAIDDLEIELGDESVFVLDIAFRNELPTCCACRVPVPAEMKRYRARVKGKDPDAVAAAEEVADTCLIYPDKDTFAKMCEHSPAIKAQLGVGAIKLATGKSESEGKE